jgi:cobalt/nickel transport system ATP-binding protein
MDKAVEIENLSFFYPDGHQGLKNINLVVSSGENLALIGPNGAGKSTLLLHLNGILRGNSTIKIFGMPVEEKNLKEIRRKIGLIFQDPEDQLFSLTVFDDVAFGPLNMGYPESEVKQRVAQALEWVGMNGYEKRSPHHLSIGEKKKIAIATVLSLSPELLVLDEPTSNLDPRSKWALIELLGRLPVSKIVAAHDLELVKALCQRTVVLDKGEIVADGNTSSILNNVSLLRVHGLLPVDGHRKFGEV